VIRSKDELDKMRKAGKVVAEIHEVTRAAIRPGVTTRDLDELAVEVLTKRNARSNFLNYNGFPAVICTSPNDMIVHGIPGDYVLQEGDIISVDAGAIVEGYHGDAAYTAPVGEVTPEATRLVLEKELPGFGEMMRTLSFAKVKTAILSRAIAGIRGRSLVVNLPGKPSAVRECLEILAPAIREGVAHLRGEDPHVIVEK